MSRTSKNIVSVVNVESDAAEPWTEGDYEEWMSKFHLRRNKKWHAFEGSIDCMFCDIKTDSGRVFGPCFYRNGKFTRVDNLDSVSASDVIAYQEFRDGPGIRDEYCDDDDEDDDLFDDEVGIEESYDEWN